MAGVLSTSVSGLQSMQAAMDMHANNIANAMTPGYSRKETTFQTRLVGGVRSEDRSTFNELTASRLVRLNGLASETEAKSSALAQMSDTMSGVATNLTDVLNTFRAGLGQAADNPNDPSLRTIVAAQAATLASVATAGIADMNVQLGSLAHQQTEVRNQALDKINQLISLNKDAKEFPNNLEIRDKQAQVGRELADLVGGELSFVDNGQTMYQVNGSVVAYGALSPLPLPAQTGGKLGGLQQSVNTVQGFLTQFSGAVKSFTNAINTANAQGVDANGNPGQDLFSFDGSTMAFVNTASGLAINTAGSVNGSNARSMVGVNTLGADTSSLAASIASQAKSASVEFSSRSSTLNQEVNLQNQEQGVDLDSETAAMKEAQQIYEANAKVIQTQASMFGTLISIFA